MLKRGLALFLSLSVAFGTFFTSNATDIVGDSLSLEVMSDISSNESSSEIHTSSEEASTTDSAAALSSADGSAEEDIDESSAELNSSENGNEEASAENSLEAGSIDTATLDDSTLDEDLGEAVLDISADESSIAASLEASVEEADDKSVLLEESSTIYAGIDVEYLDNMGKAYMGMFSADSSFTVFIAESFDVGSTLEPMRCKADLISLLGLDETAASEIENNFKFEVLKSDKKTVVTGQDSPINITMGTNDDNDLTAYITKNSNIPEGDFYLSFTFNYPEKMKDGKKIQRIYPIINEPSVFCDTEDAAYQAVRDIIRNRTNEMARYSDASNYYSYDDNGYVYGRIYVKSNLFTDGTISINDVCDFEAEREGMEPYEGDYMYNLLGNKIQRTFYYESPCMASKEGELYGFTTKDGTDYNAFEVYLPVITTKEEEDAVDSKVAELLRSTFSDVRGSSNKEKIKAVYDYITANVIPTVSGDGGSDRTYPLYHTAYHALIKGNGTCESFAQLFTRLTRELGVPSKVIMGLDASNHTYNIVDAGDGYWYYIDCSAGIYLSDSKSFSRYPEQERFTSAKFVTNYLKKIKGGTNISVDSIKVLDKFGSVIFGSIDISDICNYIDELAAAGEDGLWTIRLDSNWTIDLDSNFTFASPEKVVLDLNGHTLTCKNSCQFNIGAVKNGTIKVGKSDGYSSYSGNVIVERADFENVTIQGATGHDHFEIYPLGASTNITFIDVKFSKLDVLINYNRDNVIENNDASDITVDGTLTIANCYFYAANSTGYDHPVMSLSKGAGFEFSGTNYFGGWDYGIPPYDNYQGNLPNDYYVCAPIEIVPIDYEFTNGDVIATYSGILKKITNAKGSTAPATLSDIFDIEATVSHKDSSDENLGLMTIGNNLLFAKATYEVTIDGEDTSLGSFVTLAEAVSAINGKAVANNSYTITLLDNNSGTEAFVTPSKARQVTITSKDQDVKYAFKHTGNATLSGNLVLKNIKLSPQTNGATLNLNGKTLTLYGVEYIDNGDDQTGEGSYASITGTGNSVLNVEGDNNLDIEAKINIANINQIAGSYPELKVDNLTVTNLYLMPETTTFIGTKAAITNLYIGMTKDGNEAEGNACIYRKIDTAIAVNTKLVAANTEKNKLSISTVDDSGQVVGTPGGTVLFTTKLKTFPYELITIEQTEGYEDYTQLYKLGNDIIVGKECLKVMQLSNDESSDTELGTFVTWPDAIASIEADGKNLKAADYRDYEIVLTDDLDIRQKMTFPKKAKSLTIRCEDGKAYTLTHRGDLAPTLTVVFSNIILDVPDGIKAKLNIGGNKVCFDNAYSNNVYSAISGNAKSELFLTGDEEASGNTLKAYGAITLGSLDTLSYDVSSENAGIIVQKLTSLENASIDVAANISFKDLISNDGNNEISYGHTAKNTFKITGNVSSNGAVADINTKDEEGHTNVVNSCAISVTNIYMNSNGYNPSKDLIAAPKAPACFFVVERSGIDTEADPDVLNVKYTTKKVKNALRINTDDMSDTSGAVVLRSADEYGAAQYSLGYFADLNGALNEIKAINSKSEYYLIEIDGSKDYGKEDNLLDTSNISTPSWSAGIIITSLDENKPAYLHVKNSLSLGSPLTLKNIAIGNLTDKKGNTVKLSINLAGYTLKLENVDISASESGSTSERIGKISGNGTAKASVLEISGEDTLFAVNADLVNVGKVSLKDGIDLLVTGKTSIGKLELEEDSSIISYAKVKRDKKQNIISVISPIAMTDTISGNGELKVILLEKNGTEVKEIELATDDGGNVTFSESMFDPLKPAFQIIKAPLAGADKIQYTSGGEMIKKNGSYYLVNGAAKQVGGYYHLESSGGSRSDYVDNDYVTFADLVWDINNIKDREAIYTVTVCGSDLDDGSVEMSKAEKYAMPKAAAFSGLEIAPPEGVEDCVLKYTPGTTITFTRDTSITGIVFEPDGSSKPLNLNLGGNILKLTDTNCTAGFGNITGNGISSTKKSKLDVVFSSSDKMIVTGNLKNVNNVMISSSSEDEGSVPELIVYGKTNVGELYKTSSSLFSGSAAIKLDKNKENVTSVTSNVSILNAVGTITYDDEGEMTVLPEFDLSLIYKKNSQYVPLIGSEDGSYNLDNIPALENKTFKLFNTSKIMSDAEGDQYSISYTGYDSSHYSVIRVKNVLYLMKN